MCGIVGLFLKDKSMEPQLGALLTDMLITMTDRGPDSAGIAIYRSEEPDNAKLTVQSDTPETDFLNLKSELEKAIQCDLKIRVQSTHAVLEIQADQMNKARVALKTIRPNVRVMSTGESLEIFH